MKQIHDWATAWQVPHACMADLLHRLGMGFDSPQHTELEGVSETAVQNNVRLDAAHNGTLLFRNNVGALTDENGRPVRYGLCNDSAKVNKEIKSGDLIGLRKLLITSDLVGHTVGQFVSRECKPAGWVYTGTPREVAQAKWVEIIISYGGDAAFTTGRGGI